VARGFEAHMERWRSNLAKGAAGAKIQLYSAGLPGSSLTGTQRHPGNGFASFGAGQAIAPAFRMLRVRTGEQA
jgi:hypothetical protein